MKFVNFCAVTDTGDVFVDINKFENDYKDENGKWFWKDNILVEIVKGNEGYLISDDNVDIELEDCREGMDSDDEFNEFFDKKVQEFKQEVNQLGTGGKYYVWSLEYDSNVLYVIE